MQKARLDFNTNWLHKFAEAWYYAMSCCYLITRKQVLEPGNSSENLYDRKTSFT